MCSDQSTLTLDVRQYFKIFSRGCCGVPVPKSMEVHVVITPGFQQAVIDIKENIVQLFIGIVCDGDLRRLFERHWNKAVEGTTFRTCKKFIFKFYNALAQTKEICNRNRHCRL